MRMDQRFRSDTESEEKLLEDIVPDWIIWVPFDDEEDPVDLPLR